MSCEALSTIEPQFCPCDEIAAYIDGELDGARESELEVHFARCQACALEVNEQKHFLRNLDISLKHEKELELPVDFAKQIVANAESTVSGLRRPRERFNALFICAGLSLFVLFTLGAETGNLFSGLSGVAEKTIAVADIFGHLVYSFFVGLAIIVRSIASQFQIGVSPVIALSFLIAIFSLAVSRRILDDRRA